MTYRVAVIGAGGIAGEHLEAMAHTNRLQPCGIADVKEERAAALAARYGIRAYPDYRVMLAEERPDIAIVTLPHYLHRESAIHAAEQGCHILLEKPMAMSVAECDDIAAAVRRHGVKLMVGHTQHYTDTNIEAKRWIEGGRLGRLVMVTDRRHLPYDKPGRPYWFFETDKAGGGILMNLGSHTIDKIQWLTGSRIVKVRASVVSPLGRGDVEGGGLAWLETAAGIPAVMCQSGYPGAPVDETELLFTQGSLKLITGVGLWASEGGEYREVPVPPGENPFLLQLNDLLHSIRTGEEPACSMAYSRSVIAAVQGIYRSQQSGTEVEVEPDGGQDA